MLPHVPTSNNFIYFNDNFEIIGCLVFMVGSFLDCDTWCNKNLSCDILIELSKINVNQYLNM